MRIGCRRNGLKTGAPTSPSQQVKKQMEKTTLICLGLFPHNGAQSQQGPVDFTKGWVEWDITTLKVWS